ncbi:hypothetical protein V2J09_021272 [Rumex salicifolius]
MRANAEPDDQNKYLEDRCKPKCAKPLYEYKVESEKKLREISSVFSFALTATTPLPPLLSDRRN